jgi:TRAP transporter 4TM/12TM fusion protein
LAGAADAPAPDWRWRGGSGRERALFAVAVAFAAFQIYTAAFSPLSSIVLRSVHVGFLLLLAFALRDRRGRAAGRTAMLDWGLGGLGFLLGLYHWVFEAELIQRAGDPSTPDLVVAAATVLLVFEAARRVMGPALPTLCAVFLGYALLGNWLPGPLRIRPYGLDQVLDQLALGTEGIYGTPIFVSATYIFLFILFGTFLERSGMIQLFNDVAMGTVGHTRGGPAKVAVISSALMGTINGSGVANVVTVGQFTIPLMKRFGYDPAFAGAVEATASMGGQIMPPVMGAVAFIMAETLGVPYLAIVKAAIIPALLYFGAALWMVHLEAGRARLVGLPRDQIPGAAAALTRRWYLLLPLAALVYLLFGGYTPLFAGTVGLGLTAVLILGAPLSQSIGAVPLRIAFWVLLGIAGAGFFQFGIVALFALIAALAVLDAALVGGRATLRIAVASLAEGARNALSVGIACALVGVLIGVVTLTGLATSIAGAIVAMAGTSLFLALALTMVTCLVLGMGIPTIPNYIITSSLVGPALLQLGVPLLISHMFVFYFGIMADLTPPVALAAFAAAAIARAPVLAIGVNCMRIAVAGFVVPFMAVYDPALMLQRGGPGAVAYVAGKAVLAVMLWGGASIGWFTGPLAWWERGLATAAAFLLVAAIPWTDESGFALALLFLLLQWRRRRAGAAA